MRRRRQRKAVLLYLLFILLVLVLAWWMAGDNYRPYPPATPTPGYWPTRVTATIVPSATPTKVIHTPIQPTYAVTPTSAEPSPTAEETHTPVPIFSPTLTVTPIPILYTIVKDKQTVCMTYFIRAWGVKAIPRCWQYERNRAVIPTPCGPDCVIWWEPIPETPPVSAVPFTGTPIYIP